MTTLTEGNTYSVTLAAGEKIHVKTVGVAKVKYARQIANGASVDTLTPASAEIQYGPYGVPMEIEIEAVTGNANYSSTLTYGMLSGSMVLSQQEYDDTAEKRDDIEYIIIGS